MFSWRRPCNAFFFYSHHQEYNKGFMSQWFHNIKLMKKLMFTFLIVVFILVIQGGLGWNHLNMMGGLSAELYQKNILPLNALNTIQNRIIFSRLTVFRHISATEDQEMEKIQATSKKEQDELRGYFAHLASYHLTAREEIVFQEMVEQWQTLQEDYQKIIQSSTDYAKEEGVEGMVFNQAAFDQINERLVQLIRAKEKQAQFSYEQGVDVVQESQISTIVSILLGLIVALTFGIILARSITGPIKKVTEILEKMSNGNLKERSGWETQDEIGQMVRSMDQFAEKISLILGQVQVTANEVASGSQQIADSSQTLSQGAASQASAIEQISASMNELESQTQQNADNAVQANHLSATAKQNADEGNIHMREMMEAMTEIAESSQQISKIIKVIDEIAFQTNLLALNAAVEAARAGVHGKGFAVVSNEVRNLAIRSASAAQETTELIENSVKTVERGRTVTQNTAEALEKIVSGIQKVTDLIIEIDYASKEQTQGLSQIGLGLSQLSQVTQQNASNSDQGVATAKTLSQQATTLYSHLQKFELKREKGDGIVDSPSVELRQSLPTPEPPPLLEKAKTPQQIIAFDDEEFGKF